MSTFRKYDENAKLYSIGERGAQIIILPYPKIQFIEVDDLSETERSDGGFGSTGK
jgi:dUTP pyrophosphatase